MSTSFPATTPSKKKNKTGIGYLRVILQPRAGTLIVQMRASRPSTRFSQVPHWPFSQLNLIGARAARTL